MTLNETSPDALLEAIEKAQRAQATWQEVPEKQKRILLNKIKLTILEKAEALSLRLSQIQGKTPHEALIAEIYPVLAQFDYYARSPHCQKWSRKLHLVKANPFAYTYAQKNTEILSPGLTAIISPWNYPFFLSLMHVPSCLLAANAILIKPSEYTPEVGELITEVSIDLPENLVQVIQGAGEIGKLLIGPHLKNLFFIGSTPTGKRVEDYAKVKGLDSKNIFLELSGKDSAIVLKDADLKKTVSGILFGAFSNCGQACASIERVLVPEDLIEPFSQEISKQFNNLDSKDLGQMTTKDQAEKVRLQIKSALEDGAKLLAEKDIENLHHPERSIKACILSEVPDQSTMAQEETFGPVVYLEAYSGRPEDAINRVNDSPFGLTNSLWTQNRKFARHLAHRIQSGVVTINDHLVTASMPELPWVGWKESGNGYPQKAIYDDRGSLGFKAWEFPHTPEKKRWFKDFLQVQFGRNSLGRLKKAVSIYAKALFWKHLA